MFKRLYPIQVALFAFFVVFSAQSMEEEAVINENDWNDSIYFSALSLVEDSDDEKKFSTIEELSGFWQESGILPALDPAFTEDMKQFHILPKEKFHMIKAEFKEAKKTMVIEENYQNASSVQEKTFEEENVVYEEAASDWYSWTQGVMLQAGKYWDSAKKVTANAYSKLHDMPQQH